MDMKTICRHQIEEAKTHKWIKGVEIGRDPGEEAITEWVTKNAKKYREEYNKTYEATVQKVKDEASDHLKELLGEIPQELEDRLVRQVCDVFTEVWVKEVCLDNRQNKHLEEI